MHVGEEDGCADTLLPGQKQHREEGLGKESWMCARKGYVAFCRLCIEEPLLVKDDKLSLELKTDKIQDRHVGTLQLGV